MACRYCHGAQRYENQFGHMIDCLHCHGMALSEQSGRELDEEIAREKALNRPPVGHHENDCDCCGRPWHKCEYVYPSED